MSQGHTKFNISQMKEQLNLLCMMLYENNISQYMILYFKVDILRYFSDIPRQKLDLKYYRLLINEII